MTLLLDTDTCIDVIRGRRRDVRGRFRDLTVSGPGAVSAITVQELQVGVLTSGLEHRARNEARLEAFFKGPVEVVPFDEEDARATADVAVLLAARGLGIGPYDTQIAGQALRRGWTVVTSNHRHFGRVPGLRLETWRQPG